MTDRILRVNSLIKKEIGDIFLKELNFSNNVLVTVTRVETLKNLSETKVYISVMPEEKTKDVFKVLNKIIYDIQQKLNKRLKMRPVPKIKFEEEKKTREAGRVEELLERLKEKEK